MIHCHRPKPEVIYRGLKIVPRCTRTGELFLHSIETESHAREATPPWVCVLGSDVIITARQTGSNEVPDDSILYLREGLLNLCRQV